MAVPESFLQEVRDANEIVSLIENYVELKRSGATYSCRCPFHSERTPSFHVYPNTQSYYCFGCGAGGDAITFIRTIENLDYIEAVRFLAQRAGLPMPEDRNDDSARRRQRLYEMNREAGKFFHRQLFSPEGADGWNYITGRQLTEHTIRHFGIGYAVNDYHKLHYYMRNLGFSEDELVEGSLLVRNNNRVYDKFVNRVMFPIFDTRGNIIPFPHVRKAASFPLSNTSAISSPTVEGRSTLTPRQSTSTARKPTFSRSATTFSRSTTQRTPRRTTSYSARATWT